MKYTWSWRYGEKQKRSNINNDKKILKQLQDENLESMKNAHSFSLNQDENSWDMIGIKNNNIIEKPHREELNFKVSDRQMLQQIGNNPFLENNYQNDIANHNIFLIPKNSK